MRRRASFVVLKVCSKGGHCTVRGISLRGFTLIELLVVIAIIALLMAVLMPALTRVKKQAKTVVCQARLHQWGTAWKLYTEEHNGRFLSGDEWSEIMGEGSGFKDEAKIDDHDHSWPLVLREYYGNEKLLCCPTADKRPLWLEGARVRKDNIFSCWGLWVKYPTKYIHGSYGVNSWIYDRGHKDGVKLWGRFQTKGAFKIPLMLDCYWCEGYPRHRDDPPPDRFYGEFGDHLNYMKRFCIDRHDETTNGLFLDLSSKKVGLKQLWELKWHECWYNNAVCSDPPDYTPPAWDIEAPWMAHMKDYARSVSSVP